MEECADCIHSHPEISEVEDEGPILKCRRYPPQLFVFEDEIHEGFPDAYARCGEYKRESTSGDE